jgi:hypothetical protein
MTKLFAASLKATLATIPLTPSNLPDGSLELAYWLLLIVFLHFIQVYAQISLYQKDLDRPN